MRMECPAELLSWLIRKSDLRGLPSDAREAYDLDASGPVVHPGERQQSGKTLFTTQVRAVENVTAETEHEEILVGAKSDSD